MDTEDRQRMAAKQEGLPFHVGLKQVTRENDDILLPTRMRQDALDSAYDD